MKKLILLLFITIFISGCAFTDYLEEQENLEKELALYSTGDLVTLGDIQFYVVSTSQSNASLDLITTDVLNDDFFDDKEGTTCEKLTKKMGEDGYQIEDCSDLSKFVIEEQCTKVTMGVDYKYNCSDVDFIAIDKDYWIDGSDVSYPEFVYFYNGNGMIESEKNHKGHGVRPVIEIKLSELKK